MKELIISKLKQIEKEQNVKILLAVESGSRAWGFSSPDSDYDVRFIYVRPEKDYLQLENMRDVIELPIHDMLDISGWDLKKTLRLLCRSNPTLFEWFSSPVTYLETDFADCFRKKMMKYYSAKKSLYHYLSMAENNYREYLKTETVKAKKYFYVLRPLLACQWVLDRGTPPPVLFSELAAAELPDSLREEVDRLLSLKMNAPEVKEIPRINLLNDYLDTGIVRIRENLSGAEDHTGSREELNELFFQTIRHFSKSRADSSVPVFE